MKVCPFGTVCLHTQAGFYAQGSHIPLAMSVALLVVQSLWRSKLSKQDGTTQTQQQRQVCQVTASFVAAIVAICYGVLDSGFCALKGIMQLRYCWCDDQRVLIMTNISPRECNGLTFQQHAIWHIQGNL